MHGHVSQSGIATYDFLTLFRLSLDDPIYIQAYKYVYKNPKSNYHIYIRTNMFNQLYQHV